MFKRVNRRVTAGLMAFAIVLSNVIMPAQSAFAWTTDPTEDPNTNHKSYVCKMVGTPGVNETFQTSDKPIQIDRKADHAVGAQFVDAQGNSFVVGFGYPSEPKASQPTTADCVAMLVPAPTVTAGPCVIGQSTTGTVTVALTNNDQVIGNITTYTVTINGVSQTTSPLADGDSQTLTFTGLAAGTHTVTVTGFGQTLVTTSVTLEACEEPPLTETTAPEVPVIDPCDPGNAIYGEVPASDTYTYIRNADGSITFIATEGYTFADGPTTTIPAPTETNIAPCYTPEQCAIPDQRITADWGSYPAAGGGATYTYVDGIGLLLSTPEKGSYVYGLFDAGNTQLRDIDFMSYMTRRDTTPPVASQLPSYILYVDRDGNPATTTDRGYLFFEPLYTYGSAAITNGTFQTWDAINGGNAIWWGGFAGTSDPIYTWNDIVAANPQARVLYYGFNQGTSNAGLEAYVQELTFDCATITFANPGGGGVTPEEPVTPVTPVTPTTPTPVVPVSSTLPAELPQTGATDSPYTLVIGMIISAIMYGAIYFAQPKRLYE